MNVAIGLLTATLVASHPASFVAAQPGLVAPESLAQGFVIVVRDDSGLADAASGLFLASNHSGWNPGLASMRLERRSDMRWQIIMPRPTDPAPLEFKFTRGGWDLVEVAADLSDIPNRRLPTIDARTLTAGERPVIEFAIAKFADQRPQAERRRGADPYRTIEATGDVRRLQVVGGGGGAPGMVRDLLVWLPPGYDEPPNAQRRYPVLYLHDGQNLFERPPGVPGEWQADETATRLVAEGRIEPLVIVGIPHAGPERSSEYLPVDGLRGVIPGGDAYLDFLMREVVPRVERAYRVRTDRAGRAIGGASLGAVIGLYAATRHPDTFGAVLLESMPMLGEATGPWRAYLERAGSWPARVYIGMGGRETGEAPEQSRVNARYVEWARWLEHRAADAGVASGQCLLVIEDAAAHNEDAWANRLARPLEFLFPSSGR